MKARENKGITMVTLVITIIVLLIIAGIGIYSGTGTIKKAKLEELKTNMLLIQAKAKEYVENANFKLGTKIDDAQETERDDRIGKAKAELKGEEIEKSDISDIIREKEEDEGNYIYYYKLTEEQLKEIGLSDVKSSTQNGEYIVEYDIKKAQVEIYHTKGYNGKYSLTDIEEIKE
jgi:Tfp pilus assembly protein PilE